MVDHLQLNSLQKILTSSLPTHDFKNICEYLFSNPGKLFRSKLITNLCIDLKLNKSQLANCHFLKAFVEIHHTYTLIHDDLPAMDDDDIRRAQESTHKRFGEANAILAGDALLVSSFQSISKIESSQLSSILKLTTWATGAKGLINGQFLDLGSKRKSFENILRIHELKTSRLFQVCTIGTYLLSMNKEEEKNQETRSHKLKDMMRLGSYIGILFQLLDDFKDRDESGAEFNNLFALDYNRAVQEIKSYSSKLTLLFDKYQLNKTRAQIMNYTKSVDDLI